MTRERAGAMLWIACLQYFLAEALAIQGWSGAYSLTANYISDLGAIGHSGAAGCDAMAGAACSTRHALMNASFLLQGALIAGGAALARPGFPRGRLFAVALALIAASGAGVFVVGLAPEDVAPGPHYLGAAENLFCCNAGMTAMGIALLRWRPEARRMALIALAAGAAGLAGFAGLALGIDFGLGVGGVERVAAYPFPLWLAGFGAVLARRGGLVAPGAR